DAGVVGEDVDRPPVGGDAREQRLDLRAVRDVGSVRAGGTAARRDRPRHLLGTLPVQVDHRDASALAGEPLGDRAPDAGGTARDHRHPSPEPVHGRLLYKGRLAMSTPGGATRSARATLALHSLVGYRTALVS